MAKKYLDLSGLTYLWSKIKALIPTKTSDLQNDVPFLNMGIGTDIPENADLDSYVNNGVYNCHLTATAATLVNSPTTYAFRLEVKETITNSGGTCIVQIIHSYRTNSRMWIRTKYATTWGEWKRVGIYPYSDGSAGELLAKTSGNDLDWSGVRIYHGSYAANGNSKITVTGGSRGLLVTSGSYAAARGAYIVATSNNGVGTTNILKGSDTTLSASGYQLTISGARATDWMLILYEGTATI